ncbi:unnamed protein product [Caenorhabditis angaria]|uniref:Uncharacterized protein n=1 Tax=Caenorhabditis angaria TaxID=860376 RepID=A0A9P1J4S6_9PELO|nr:unnamed protein product [Caenorhabditis angaria]
MSKILIFLIIPAVLSRSAQYLPRFSDFSTTTQPSQQQDGSIIGYQFLNALVNAARSNNYSIFYSGFTAPIFNKSGTVIGEASKESLFRIFGGFPQNINIEQVFPRNYLKFNLYESFGNHYLNIDKTEDDVRVYFTAQILGENQFNFISLVIVGVPDNSTGLIQNIIEQFIF